MPPVPRKTLIQPGCSQTPTAMLIKLQTSNVYANSNNVRHVSNSQSQSRKNLRNNSSLINIKAKNPRLNAQAGIFGFYHKKEKAIGL
jgi:hypothetical protein